MEPNPILSRARVQAARAFALAAHGDQRYGTRPYADHLDAVVATLLRFRSDEEEVLVCAGFLHDVLEDTTTTPAQLEQEFGFRVTELVAAVTASPAPTRRERNRDTWPKVIETEGAVRLKLADRIANVEACWETRERRLFMYQHEYMAFRAALWAGDGGAERPMWDALDALLGWLG